MQVAAATYSTVPAHVVPYRSDAVERGNNIHSTYNDIFLSQQLLSLFIKKMTMQRRETPSVVPPTSSIDPSSSMADGKNKSAHAQIQMLDYNDDNDDDAELNVPLFSSDYLLQQSAFVMNPSSSPNRAENPFRLNVDKYKEDMKKRRVTNRFTYVANQIIDRLQSIYLPKKFSAQLSKNILDQDSGAIHPSGRVPLVRGIEKVVNGSLPAADAVLLCGIKPLRYFWYMLSGGKLVVF